MLTSKIENQIKSADEYQYNYIERAFIGKIFGLENCTKNIVTLCTKEKIHHATLIVGPKGSGKAMLSLRLVFALLINEHTIYNNLLSTLDTGDFLSICQKVDLYRQFTNLSHPDFMLISDAFELDSFQRKKKVSINIDEIRRVKKFLSLTPAISRWRIVLVDGADNMSSNSANALLKVLEEPGKNTLILIISHNIKHTLATIRSRCCIMHVNSLSYRNFSSSLRCYVTSNSSSEMRDQYEIVQNEQKLKFLYHLTRGNMSLATSSMSFDINYIHHLITALLSGNMDGEGLAKLKELLSDEDANINQLIIDIVKTTIVERLYNKISNDHIKQDEITKYLQNFQQARELLDRAKIFNLDLGNSIFSILGV